jgi:hypothetical protein
VDNKQPRNRLPLYLGGITAVLAVALVAYLELAPKPALKEDPLTEEARAYINSLRLSDVRMEGKLNYFNQKVVEIQGQIGNAGGRNLQIVEIYCIFRDYSGVEVLRQRMAIVNEKMGGLAPGESKPFRLSFDNVPETWNEQLPLLAIASVTFS